MPVPPLAIHCLMLSSLSSISILLLSVAYFCLNLAGVKINLVSGKLFFFHTRLPI